MSTMQIHIFRLDPGEDLRAALMTLVVREGITAGFVLSAVGSLSRARLRFAGKEAATEIAADLEILSLAGTLAIDGCHLHAAVSDAGGHTTGGHVLEGCIIRTTAEVVVGEARGLSLTRVRDPRTGYRELLVGRTASKDEGAS